MRTTKSSSCGRAEEMELNMVMAIVNRDRHEAMEDVIHGLKLPLAMTL